MVLRQDATPELQHFLLHCKGIIVLSKGRVRLGKIAHGRACTSKQKPRVKIKKKESHSTHAPHQLKDGFQAARDDQTLALFPASQGHRRAF
jgi:hypothetical protein